MEIVYLNTNGFYGDKDKRNFSDTNNQKNAEKILKEIFELYSPDILFFSEFDVNSQVGKFLINFLVKILLCISQWMGKMFQKTIHP